MKYLDRSLKIYLLLTFFISTVSLSSAWGQGLHNIKGIVIDSITKKPTDYLTVSLRKSDGKTISSTLTSEDGSFLFEKLDAGRYEIKVAGMAYLPKVVSIELSDNTLQTFQIKTIELMHSNKELNEVKITGARPTVTQQIDRLVYDVHADPENKGLNVLEVMQKVPLLSIDADDNLQLKGSSNFKIYVNGKPSGVMANNPTEALRVMRALTIKKIEVITTPSAKYDSEGAAGIINIITNSQIEGYNIIFEVFRTSRLGVLGIGSAFTAKDGKFGINGYAGRYSRTDAPVSTFSNSRVSFSPYESLTNNGTSHNPKGNLIPANADLSYEIDSLNLLTSSVVLFLNNYYQDDQQAFHFFDEQGNLTRSYDAVTSSNPRNGQVDLSLNYQHGFKSKKGRFMTASYRYSKTISDFDSFNASTGNLNYIDNQTSQHNNAGLREQTMQLDYVAPGEKINIEGGAKLILRDNHSDFNTETLSGDDQALTSDNFNYGQNIYGIYNDYQLKLKEWGIYGGLRLERTVVNAVFANQANRLDKAYNNLIPSVIIQRKINGSGSLNLGYTQRIQRPGILQLNPFDNQSNPLFHTSGNPDLVPVVSNNFDLSYNLATQASFNFSLNYAFANNTLQNVVTVDNEGISHATFANLGRDDNFGADVSINYPITKNFKIDFNGRGQYLLLKGILGQRAYNNKGFSFTTSNNMSLTLPSEYRLRFLIATATPVVGLQGKVNGYVATVLSLNKEFLNKKLGLILRFDNPTQKYRTTINRFNSQDFTQQNMTMRLARGYYINLYYTIGQLKEQIKKNKRSIDNNDVDKGKNELN